MRHATLRMLFSILFVTSFFCSCTTEQPSRPFTLPSGRVVKVLAMGSINFSQGPPALMLKYETDLKLSDKDALRKEADEIFTVLRVDAENGHFSGAIVSANERPTGFILKKSRGYNFVYQKRADGVWHCLEDEKGK